MHAIIQRRPSLFDAMIAVAVIGTGIATARSHFLYEMKKSDAFLSKLYSDDKLTGDAQEREPGSSFEPSGATDSNIPPIPSMLDDESDNRSHIFPPTDLVAEREMFYKQFRLESIVVVTIAPLMCASIGLTILCLWPPRPQLEVLVTSIRFVPIMILGLTVSLTALVLIVDYFAIGTSVEIIIGSKLPRKMLRTMGSGVATAWIYLALSHKFRMHDWLDWLGIGVGASWIIAWLLFNIYH